MVYWIYKDARDEWRWYLKSVDGEKIADSGKGYKHKYDCQHALDRVKDSANTPVYTHPKEEESSIRRIMRPLRGGQE
jgi:uncharacterized protein YegP (UPF0339 family)